MARQLNVFVDGHVHIYDQADRETLLDAASDNFSAIAERRGGRADYGVLLLADPKGVPGFEWLGDASDGDGHSDAWQVLTRPDAHTLHLGREGCLPLAVVSGHQAITTENLEALIFPKIDLPAQRLSLDDTLQLADDTGALVILPWGAGKWLGKRGQLIGNAIERREPGRICFGDNGGRWRHPARTALLERAAKRGHHCIAGTDPLPLAGESCRVGTYGIGLETTINTDATADDITAGLTSAHAETVGQRLSIPAFVKNQVALRLA